MPRKLTAKQEAYKNYRIMGKGTSESYRASYNAKKMNNNAVNVAANELENHPIISLQIQEAREKATERAIVTVEDVVKGLLLEATTDGDGSTQGARVNAWKALSDYTGGFDSNKQRLEHSGNVDLVERLARGRDRVARNED